MLYGFNQYTLVFQFFAENFLISLFVKLGGGFWKWCSYLWRLLCIYARVSIAI